MTLTPLQENELRHLQSLVEARTDGAGKPKPGFGANVRYLQALIADLEALRDSPDAVDG
jgi:hypothetical protein